MATPRSEVAAFVQITGPRRGFGFLDALDGSGDAFLHGKIPQVAGRETVSERAKLSMKETRVDASPGSSRSTRPLSRPSLLDQRRPRTLPDRGFLPWCAILNTGPQHPGRSVSINLAAWSLVLPGNLFATSPETRRVQHFPDTRERIARSAGRVWIEMCIDLTLLCIAQNARKLSDWPPCQPCPTIGP